MATQQWVAIRRSTVPVPAPSDDRRDDVPPPDRRPDRKRAAPPEPHLADDIDPRELPRAARADLRSLPESLAERVAMHLVAAARLIDEDPTAAVAHAWYARRLAPRLAVVREAAGIASYRTGDFGAALAELRAVRRMTGDPSYLPMLADCERGLGRPERALALVSDPDTRRLAPADRVELTIVESGARRDRGEFRAAVLALQGPELDRSDVAPWTVRLWYAYAAALLDAGRVDEARQWFESVVAIDEAAETDAEERLAALDQEAGRPGPSAGDNGQGPA
jgi:tetratricopeptide (TPR) repeat protein